MGKYDHNLSFYHLFKKHGLQLSGLRSHGEFLTDDDIARKRALADELRQHPERLANLQQEARTGRAARITENNGAGGRSTFQFRPWMGAAAGVVAGAASWLFFRRGEQK